MPQPSYLLLSDADWTAKIAAAEALASPCRLCPRACGVDRLKGEKGFCRAPGGLQISSIFPHHGEEPPISGSGGSGTVFFSWCTLRCIFCQNFQISHQGEGKPYSTSELARHMLRLQELGCHNINWVTPDHYLPWILRSLREAAAAGLHVPIVYNCSGYECLEALDILNSVVDIYLPDMKYGSNGPATEFSSAADYVQVNQAAIRAMFRQVGPLKVDADGVAIRGLCIRHLVLPQGASHSEEVARFLAEAFDPDDIHISLMAQYRPLHRACEYAVVNRPLTPQEYEPLKAFFLGKGFPGFYQEIEELDAKFVIDFQKRKHEPLTGE